MRLHKRHGAKSSESLGKVFSRNTGGVAEWLKAAVLKTAVPQGTVGSNPTPSAMCPYTLMGNVTGLRPQAGASRTVGR